MFYCKLILGERKSAFKNRKELLCKYTDSNVVFAKIQ